MLKFCIACYSVYTLSFVPTYYVLDKSATKYQRRMLAYQIASVFGNGFMGIAGVYYEYCFGHLEATLEGTVQGFREFQVLSAFQFAYQVWALPVGILHVNESMSMILHHISVLFVSLMAGCFTNGFRYHTPFFFGMFEISSVPLVVMNMFRDNKSWQKSYPGLNQNIRISFALSFLLVRIVLSSTRSPTYLRDLWYVFSSSNHVGYLLFMYFVFLSSVLLFGLQIWWGWLIVNGMFQLLFGKTDDKEKKDS